MEWGFENNAVLFQKKQIPRLHFQQGKQTAPNINTLESEACLNNIN